MKTRLQRNFLYVSLVAFLFCQHTVIAGGLAFIEDYEGKLHLFHHGTIEQLEHNQAKQTWVGEDFAVYIDYMNNLKVWYNGRLKSIDNGTESFYATENLIYWKIAGNLHVWYQGQKMQISRDAPFVRASGSLIYFEDDFENALKVFYKGKTIPLAHNNYDLQTKAFDVGRSSAIVEDANGQYYIFVDGAIYIKQFTTSSLTFSAGGEGVLVKNEDSGDLEYFTKNGSKVVDYFAPKWFKTSYKWVVWGDLSNQVYLFENNQKIDLVSNKPAIFRFSPKSFLFDDQNQLYIYRNGQKKLLCYYIPSRFDIYNDYFVHINQSRQIELITPLETKQLSSGNASYELVYDVVVLYEGNKRRIYYNNRFYSL